ncbi:MAG: hypothetical protein EHM49_01030 [Deltaproteobacteria bacterium]|nr:MAG: hypothetical protein EHM49_01030 [Deltaproteobacteria bacterium]
MCLTANACLSVVVSSVKPGDIHFKEYSSHEMVQGRAIFKRLCELYSLTKDLPFSWWSDEFGGEDEKE